MFSLGLGLTVDDFTRVMRSPRDFLIGTVLQMVLLPFFGFTLVYFWEAEPELAVGLMIIAAAPGGATSNLLTAFARGDVALSISLTATASLLSIFTVPAILAFSHNFFMSGQLGAVSIHKAALSIFSIITLPVMAGVMINVFYNKFAAKLVVRTKSLSGILFLLY